MDAFAKEIHVYNDGFTPLLLSNRRPQEAYRHAEDIYFEAVQLIRDFLPDFVPNERTVAFINPGDVVGGGEYLGKINNTHYLDIGFPNKPENVSKLSRENILTLYIHELIHQKQLELPNIASALPQFSIKDDGIPRPKQENAQEIKNILDRNAQSVNMSYLQQVLLEGFAMQCELIVLNNRIERAQGEGNVELLRLLSPDQTERSNRLQIEPYKTGAMIVEKLINNFGAENIFLIMKSLDFAACEGVDADSDMMHKVIENPSILPGLENLN